MFEVSNDLGLKADLKYLAEISKCYSKIEFLKQLDAFVECAKKQLEFVTNDSIDLSCKREVGEVIYSTTGLVNQIYAVHLQAELDVLNDWRLKYENSTEMSEGHLKSRD